MRALRYHGKEDIRCDNVPDPRIEDARDAIVQVTSCAICGSDLRLYDGCMPGMLSGDIVGHEFMGEVVEVGNANRRLKIGDRVVVRFTISCGECEHANAATSSPWARLPASRLQTSPRRRDSPPASAAHKLGAITAIAFPRPPEQMRGLGRKEPVMPAASMANAATPLGDDEVDLNRQRTRALRILAVT